MRQNYFPQGRTNREGALLHYSWRKGVYYSVGRTNREGRSNRGSTVWNEFCLILPNFTIQINEL